MTAGTFKVNGKTIDVNANDTINTVLNRINASAAGVTATVSGDKVTLVSKTYSDQDIKHRLRHVRLRESRPARRHVDGRGNLRDDQRVLRNTAVFGAVGNGTFTVNGQTIAVNKNTDTVATRADAHQQLRRRRDRQPQLTTNKIELVTNGNSEDQIVVANDTTGFVARAKLADRQHRARQRPRRPAGAGEDDAVRGGGDRIVHRQRRGDRDQQGHRLAVLDRQPGQHRGRGVTAAYDTPPTSSIFTPTNGHADRSAATRPGSSRRRRWQRARR